MKSWISISFLCMLFPLSNGQLGSSGQVTLQGAQISQATQSLQGTAPTSQYPQGGTQISQGGAQATQNYQGVAQGTQISQGLTQGAQISQGGGQGISQGATQGTQFSQGTVPSGQFFQNIVQGTQAVLSGAQHSQAGAQGSQFPQSAAHTAQHHQGTAQPAQSGTHAILKEMEKSLAEFKAYVEYLENMVYKERMKYPSPYIQNFTASPSNFTYTTFENDVDMRLSSMERISSELVKQMVNCPRGPVPPPPPQSVMVQSDTVDNSSNIYVSWDPPYFEGKPLTGENMHYKVYFSPSDQYGKATGGEFIFRICDANFTQASVTDLNPRSFYSIQVAATLCEAIESEGTSTSVKTPDLIPSAPLNLKLEGTKPNAFAVSWDPPTVKGTLTNYTIYATEESGKATMVTIDPKLTSYALYNLYEGTMYTIRIAASSDNGMSPKSEPLEVTTDKFIPMAPRNVRAIDNNLTSVTLEWDAPLPGRGMIRGYRINYTLDFTDYEEMLISDPSITTATITNLTPATEYYFQVFARTMKRLGYGSHLIMNKTKMDVPSEPMSVVHRIMDNGLQRIQVSWQPPENTYGPIIDYIIHWGVRGGATRKEFLTPYVLSWTSDFLDDNANHDFKLFAQNVVGIGKPVAFSVKTLPKPQILVPNVRVKRETSKNNITSLTVTWGSPKVPVDGFFVLYRKYEGVYSDRWKFIEIPKPNARGTTITVTQENVPYVVVCKGFKRQKKPTSNLSSQQFSFPGQQVGQQQSNPWI
uniref:Fibronectin type III domain-containing protein 1 n=1 Tax=Margaritifera margaritifera TaxID=102329 RepID=FND1_PINMG|nr:RecName: Full=Fibronectin type III domain-containing protein 1; Flags: Precursor [Pinctada margaritifera]CCE46158.1 fibronectin 1 [Pinctada margaritifera]